MNILGITAGAIATVNPQSLCQLQMSVGYTIGPDGTQIPRYETFANVPAQVQALSYTDLMKLGALNIEGTRRSIYLEGNWEGLNRQQAKGGDLITFPSLPGFPGPTVWLVALVAEWWQDWCRVLVTLQNGS